MENHNKSAWESNGLRGRPRVLEGHLQVISIFFPNELLMKVDQIRKRKVSRSAFFREVVKKYVEDHYARD